ncbi:MAG: DUF368 domain-containing protein [Bacilli bacterium]|nr:DUF368 domain-containing protein [Bacilli bacterium]
MNKFLYSFLSGILIGTCMILPGVSGSVVAIMLGVYEEIIFLLNSNETNRRKITKIFPIAFGILIGVFIFGKILLIFYNKYTFYMMYIFMGLILGSVPVLTREINEKNEKIDIKILAISFFISVILFIIPKIYNFEISNNLNFINLFLGGFLYISGKIIPGISSSFFLMTLGLYNYLLELITNPFYLTLNKFISIIPFLLGAIIGFILLIKVINYLLNNYFSKTYSGIIGFIIGSILAIYPGIEINLNCMFAFILFLISFEFVNKLSKK